MSTYRWTPEEQHLLRLLHGENIPREDMVAEFQKRHGAGLGGFPCARTIASIEKKCEREGITYENCADYIENNGYEHRIAQMEKIKEEYKQTQVINDRGLIDSDKLTRKILTMSDFHLPHARVDLVKGIIEQHKDADVVVLNGDLLDGYAFSSWEKDRRICAAKEYQMGFNLVRALSMRFPMVVLTKGNHDVRPARALKRAGFEKDATQVLQPDLLARIANGEELDDTGMLVRKHDMPNVIYQQVEPWYVLVGKTIFAHNWNRGSSKPGWTVQRLAEYFDSRYDKDEWDSLVVGHTHKTYKGIVKGKLLIEQGCMADMATYAHSARMQYAANAANGYAVIYQDSQGNTDYNWSHAVYLGEAMPPKKNVLELQ